MFPYKQNQEWLQDIFAGCRIVWTETLHTLNILPLTGIIYLSLYYKLKSTLLPIAICFPFAKSEQ